MKKISMTMHIYHSEENHKTYRPAVQHKLGDMLQG